MIGKKNANYGCLHGWDKQLWLLSPGARSKLAFHPSHSQGAAWLLEVNHNKQTTYIHLIPSLGSLLNKNSNTDALLWPSKAYVICYPPPTLLLTPNPICGNLYRVVKHVLTQGSVHNLKYHCAGLLNVLDHRNHSHTSSSLVISIYHCLPLPDSSSDTQGCSVTFSRWINAHRMWVTFDFLHF